MKDVFLRLLPPPPDILPGKKALADLLASCRLYCSERQDVQPFEKSRVSWPNSGAEPVDVLPLHPDGDRARRLLRDPEDQLREREASGVSRPYMSPILRSRPRMYYGFVAELHARGLIEFARCGDQSFTAECCCVVKKSGALRLVSRLANMQYIAPPVTPLPSAAALAAVEAEHMDVERQCFMATADISNAFCNMQLPR